MISKSRRNQVIKDIIHTHEVGTQDELLALLKDRGVDVTQATLSRDLKTLQVAKVFQGEKGYVYSLPDISTMQTQILSPDVVQLNGFVSLSFSHNIAVIKTLPGYANSIGYILDNLGFMEILGTISGDDTIMIVLKENVSPPQFKESLKIKIPTLKGMI